MGEKVTVTFLSGKTVEVSIPTVIGMDDYATIMESMFTFSDGEPKSSPFKMQVTALETLVRSTDGKRIAWKQVMAADGIKIYRGHIEPMLSFLGKLRLQESPTESSVPQEDE